MEIIVGDHRSVITTKQLAEIKRRENNKQAWFSFERYDVISLKSLISIRNLLPRIEFYCEIGLFSNGVIHTLADLEYAFLHFNVIVDEITSSK